MNDWLVVVGAGGGLGHIAVQYGLIHGARVLGIDTGSAKKDLITSYGASWLDFATSSDLVADVHKITGGGANAVVVTAGNAKAFAAAAEMLKIGGTLCCCGIPPGKPYLQTPISTIVIKGLRIKGNLVGNLKECLEAVELVRLGLVKPKVFVRPFKDLPEVYEELERGDVSGRIVLKVGDDPEEQVRSRL